MDGQYLIPANTKRGMLILNYFKPLDLGILITGVLITIILELIFNNVDTTYSWIKLVSVIPGAIATMLCVPVPNYHNVREFIGEIYAFYTSVRRLKWRGWCAEYESRPKKSTK